MVLIILAQIITWVSNILIIILLARSVLSWIIYSGIRYNQDLAKLFQFLTGITEPIVAPVRRFISRFVNTGMLDLAPLVTFFLIIIISRILTGILYALA